MFKAQHIFAASAITIEARPLPCTLTWWPSLSALCCCCRCFCCFCSPLSSHLCHIQQDASDISRCAAKMERCRENYHYETCIKTLYADPTPMILFTNHWKPTKPIDEETGKSVLQLRLIRSPWGTTLSNYAYSYAGSEKWMHAKDCDSCLSHYDRVRYCWSAGWCSATCLPLSFDAYAFDSYMNNR